MNFRIKGTDPGQAQEYEHQPHEHDSSARPDGSESASATLGRAGVGFAIGLSAMLGSAGVVRYVYRTVLRASSASTLQIRRSKHSSRAPVGVMSS